MSVFGISGRPGKSFANSYKGPYLPTLHTFRGFTQDYKNSPSYSHMVTIGGEIILFFGSLQTLFHPSDLCNLITLSYKIPIFDCCRVSFSMETKHDSPSHRGNNSTVSPASIFLTQDTPSELLRNVS